MILRLAPITQRPPSTIQLSTPTARCRAGSGTGERQAPVHPQKRPRKKGQLGHPPLSIGDFGLLGYPIAESRRTGAPGRSAGPAHFARGTRIAPIIGAPGHGLPGRFGERRTGPTCGNANAPRLIRFRSPPPRPARGPEACP